MGDENSISVKYISIHPVGQASRLSISI